MKFINFKKLGNLFSEQFWKIITLFYIMMRMPTIRPLAKAGEADAIQPTCIPSTSRISS